MKNKGKIVPFILVVLLLLGGCSYFENAKKEQEAFGENNKDDIIIGVAYPIGEIDSTTQYIKGIEMGVDEINMGGGINGRKIRLLLKDDEGSVTVGTSVAQSFVDNPEVMAVIGHWNSRVSVAASGIYEKAGMVMMSAASTSPELTKKGYKNIFSYIPNDQQIGEVMVDFAVQKGYTKAVIYYADDSYGRGLANAIEDHAKRRDLKIVDRLTEFGGEQHFRRLRDKWNAFGNEVLFIADVMPQGGIFVDKIRSFDIDMPIIGSTGLDRSSFIEMLGEKAEDVIIPSLFNPKSINGKIRTFVNRFKAEYAVEPDLWAVQGYEVVKILSYAMMEAESITPSNIGLELRKIEDWEDTTGVLNFNERGEAEGKTFSKKIVKNGQFQYVIE